MLMPCDCPVCSWPSSPRRRSITPYGQAATQYPQPLHTSSCTTTVPNSVRNRAPVGQTSRHPACVQCLQTSDDINQRNSAVSGGAVSGGLVMTEPAGAVAPED